MDDDEFWKMILAGSATHRVIATEQTIQIFPVDGTFEALRAFQPIAEEAIERGAKEGTKVIQHFSSQFPGRLRDKLVVED